MLLELQDGHAHGFDSFMKVGWGQVLRVAGKEERERRGGRRRAEEGIGEEGTGHGAITERVTEKKGRPEQTR